MDRSIATGVAGESRPGVAQIPALLSKLPVFFGGVAGRGVLRMKACNVGS